jgi:hypothetical protein
MNKIFLIAFTKENQNVIPCILDVPNFFKTNITIHSPMHKIKHKNVVEASVNFNAFLSIFIFNEY